MHAEQGNKSDAPREDHYMSGNESQSFHKNLLYKKSYDRGATPHLGVLPPSSIFSGRPELSVLRAVKVIGPVVRAVADILSVRIHHRDGLVLRVAEVGKGRDLCSFRRPV